MLIEYHVYCSLFSDDVISIPSDSSSLKTTFSSFFNEVCGSGEVDQNLLTSN